MDHHTFAANPLRCAVSAVATSGKTLAKPIKHTAAILAASTIGMTSGAAIAEEGAMLEEIIVTATRREASLQDVAIPMTAISGEELERKFAQDLRDLTNASPNVQFEPVGIFQNAASFYIRGQGGGDIESATDAKVGIYVDGVAQPRVSTALGDMLDVQSVEILRGPQGTLFGRNTIAGAVLVQHNEPEFNEFGTRLSVQAGDFGRLDAKAVVNIPLMDDTLAARIAVKSTNHDGYWKNSFIDKDRGASDRITINPSIKWQASDALEIVVRGEYADTKDDTNMTQSTHYCRDDPITALVGGGSGPGGSADNDLVILTETLYNLIVLQQDAVTAAANAATICGKPFKTGGVSGEYTAPNTEDRGQKYNTEVKGITWQADYDWADYGTFTYIGNYREVEEDIIFTIDVSNHDLFAGQRITDADQFSQELRFASDFSDKFDFVAGAYYFKQEYAMKQSSWGMLFAPNIVLNAPDPTVITFTNPSSYGQAQFSNQDNEAWAVFTQANWHITDALTLTVGGRYTDESKTFYHCAVGSGNESLSQGEGADKATGCNNSPAFVIDPTLPPIAPPATGTGVPTPVWQLVPAIGFDTSGGEEGGCRPVLDPAGAPIFCNNRLAPKKASWDDFTPMAGLTYQITDDIMAYFTYSAGFTAGAYGGRGGSASTIGPYDPEKADNYEIGFKSDWFDNRLRFNATAFWTTVDDFQTAFIRAAPGGGGQETIQANLGSLETNGVEFEVTAIPAQGLTVWANLSFLDTKRKGFCTDGDGPSGTDPLNPPSEGGPFSQGLPICGPPERIDDAIGNFVGWLIPNDLAQLNPTARSPDWTAAAGFAYTMDVSDLGNVTVALDWQHSEEQTISGSRINELPGVQQYNGDFISHFRNASDIFNASAVWRSPEDRYEVAFFVKNFTNELYNQATTNVAGLVEFRVPNIRRHWAVEFKANLGSI